MIDDTPARRHRTSSIAIAALFAACGPFATRPGAPAPVFAFVPDTNRVEVVAPGVTHRYVYTTTGPWAAHVLDVDLAQCYSAIAVKGAEGAAGRQKTSALLKQIGTSAQVIGGVNADFFSLAGFQGVPTGALITRGRVITGPYSQPVLAVDSSGALRAMVLSLNGSVTLGGRRVAIAGWNRPAPSGLSFYDDSWGKALDTSSSVIEVVLDGRSPARVVSVDTTTGGARIPTNGGVLIAGRTASADLRSALLALQPGDTLHPRVTLAPFHPREAVGGRPMLARDSVIVSDVDTEGQASFRLRNPRTAVGIANRGKRLILVVVDGRQAPYSDGMTLRELASFMLALGSRDAINLDGGGSSALVYADPLTHGELRVANHPSDATGERAVGDALAIVRGCSAR